MGPAPTSSPDAVGAGGAGEGAGGRGGVRGPSPARPGPAGMVWGSGRDGAAPRPGGWAAEGVCVWGGRVEEPSPLPPSLPVPSSPSAS